MIQDQHIAYFHMIPLRRLHRFLFSPDKNDHDPVFVLHLLKALSDPHAVDVYQYIMCYDLRSEATFIL